MITVSGITKEYGRTPILRGIDLEVQRGEFVSLLGPSGCGKTTLLRCLAGLERISGGEIRVGGRVMSTATQSVPPEDRQVGMIFQSYALWPHMTVYQNIAYGLRLHKTPSDELDRRVKEALAMVGLAHYAKRYPVQLSGGQQQRVALARTAAMRPHVLLFDEPLSNLDAQLRQQMRLELRDLQRNLGITAVYVTHDQAEAMAMSDRIVLMREGQVVQQGSPYEMYTAPATAYAANFLGTVNFVPANVEAITDGQPTVVASGGVRLQFALPGTHARGEQVLLGIRPEEILVNQDAAGPNTFTARVAKSVYMGGEIHLELAVEGLKLRAVAPSRNFPGGSAAQTCLVTLPPARLMYIPFDDLGVMQGKGPADAADAL